jgi:TM2 domain-containing membrane protein YozV
MKMSSKEEVQEKEESIRKLVRELPDDRRLKFFKESEKKLKDPDTYATLNYIFIAGLHHFYLGKWGRGLINIVVFWVGVRLLFTDYPVIGVIIILAISIFELYELFKSQTVVQEHNNLVMEEIYQNVHKA